MHQQHHPKYRSFKVGALQTFKTNCSSWIQQTPTNQFIKHWVISKVNYELGAVRSMPILATLARLHRGLTRTKSAMCKLSGAEESHTHCLLHDLGLGLCSNPMFLSSRDTCWYVVLHNEHELLYPFEKFLPIFFFECSVMWRRPLHILS